MYILHCCTALYYDNTTTDGGTGVPYYTHKQTRAVYVIVIYSVSRKFGDPETAALGVRGGRRYT